MSTVIRSCPGCKSLILSDTDQCPECGHVFYERRKTETSGVAPSTPDAIKSASIQEACPHCGEMVRSGLVRCWSCNGFMRADVAARYRAMTTNPQPIIYSTIPPEQRTDYLPARADASTFDKRKAVDTDDFQLGSGVNSAARSDFEVDTIPSETSGAVVASAAPGSAASPAVDGPDKPQSTTEVGSKRTAATSSGRNPAQEETEKAEEKAAPAGAGSGASSRSSRNEDDLFSIAVEEQKEVKKRRGQKATERLRKQVLVPCSCGAWIRVNEDQAGKSVRCKQCKQVTVVPGLRKKTEKADKPAESAVKTARNSFVWIDDAWFHILAPASLVLKPGSLTGKHTEVDIAVTEAGLQILTFAGPAKKRSLFSFVSSTKKVDRQIRRKQIRDQITASGDFKNLENVEIRFVDVARVPETRLVQPVAKVSESMFAGVPVFGEGRIAVFLPVALEEGKQAFLSFPISSWRSFSLHLKNAYGLELPATENGIPDSEKTESLSCFLNQSRIESVKGLTFYQQDPAFQLELTGYKCKSCGTAISEEGRKKAKLGGVKGRGIAKAKCPKCSQKMQAEPLYKITKAPEPATPADAG